MIRVVELLVAYGLIGLGCAAAAVWQGTRGAFGLLALAVFWPLLAPFTLTRGGPTAVRGPGVAEDDAASGFLDALYGLEGTELAGLLPEPGEAQALAERLRATQRKVRELDALLARDDFSDTRAEARARELAGRGDGLAAEAARGRAELLRRLQALRARWADELEAVGELLAQFRVQAAVARLAGEQSEGAARLVDELVGRVAGLDAVLEDAAFLGHSSRRWGRT